MFRRIAAAALGLSILLLLRVVPVQAADDVLKLVPDSALGFLAIRNAAEADAKLQQLGKSMELPIPSLLEKFRKESGIREGMDEKGTVALVPLPPSSDRPVPTLILLVPVTDYGKFLSQLKHKEPVAGVTEFESGTDQLCVRQIGGYAALTELQWKAALTETMRLSEKVPEPLATWGATIAENDVTVVILQPGLKLLSAQVQKGIEAMKAAMAAAGEQGKQVAAGLELYAKLFKAVEREVSAVGYGLRLDREGTLRLTKRARFIPSGSWARLAAKVKPAHENLLAGLPAGPYLIAGGGSLAEGAADSIMEFAIGAMKSMRELYGLTDEQIDQMTKLSKDSMKRMRGMSMVMGVGPAGSSVYSRMIVTMRVDDSAAYLTEYEKSMKEYSRVMAGANSSLLPPMEVEKVQLDGAAALQFTMKIPKMPAGPQPPQAAKMMEVLFGTDGKLTGWIAAADEHTVVAGYVNKDFVRETISAVKKGAPGLRGDANVSKTAALLPPDASLVAFWSPQGTVEFVGRMVALFTAGQPFEMKIPPFDVTPPIGIAMTSAPGELQGHVVVPAEVFKAVGRYIEKVKPKAEAVQ
jgi:hypothetical protein